MAKKGDIVVIGGGALGMLSARALADSGREVTLIERGRLGRGTSRAGGGIMSPLAPWEAPPAVAALAGASLPLLPEITAALARDTGIDSEYRVTGVLYLDSEDPETVLDHARRHGLRAERLDAARLAGVEPAAARGQTDAVLLPDIGQLRNPRFLDALAADLRRRGVRILEEAGEAGLALGDNGVRVEAGVHGTLHADDVVVAAGAWSARLLAPLGLQLPVHPVRGQMLWYLLPRPLLQHILLRRGRYVIPRREGVVLVGSTVEEAGFDESVTTAAAEELKAAATEMMPLLGALPVQGQWSGLRPRAPDGIPLIGRVPGVRNLWVNTGHFRNGINLAPGSAALLASLLGGNRPVVDPSPYDPATRMAQAGPGEYNARH